jgi:hypothetical protein
MTETTTFIHQVTGHLTNYNDGRFTAEFTIGGLPKILSGKFEGEIPPPLRAPHVTLHFEHPDHLHGEFILDHTSHPIVGPNNLHLPFVKPGIRDPVRFLIEGPLAAILPGAIHVKGKAAWMIW